MSIADPLIPLVSVVLRFPSTRFAIFGNALDIMLAGVSARCTTWLNIVGSLGIHGTRLRLKSLVLKALKTGKRLEKEISFVGT